MFDLKPAAETNMQLINGFKNFEKFYVFPFFINNVKHEFFSVFKPEPKPSFFNFHKDNKINKNLRARWNDIHKNSAEQGILYVLNQIFSKIVGDTGTKEIELFDVLQTENDKPFFVIADDSNNLRTDILGDFHEDKRFSYKVQVNKKSYLADFIQAMKFNFYFDETLNKIDGAIIWESDNNELLNSVQSIERYYFVNFIYTFIRDQFFPLSLESFLNLFKTAKNSKKYVNDHIMPAKVVDFSAITINHLQQSWECLIEKNFLNHATDLGDNEVNYFKKDLFYEVMMMMLIMCVSIEEIKNFLTSENPEELLAILATETHKNSSIERDLSGDFLAVVKLVMNIKDENQKSVKKKKIKEKHLSRLSKTYDYYYFCDPVVLYKTDIDHRINPSALKTYLQDNDFLFYMLFTMLFPDKSMLDSVENMVSLFDVKMNYLKLVNLDKTYYIDQIMKFCCENDLYTHSFVKENMIVIFNCPSAVENKTIKSSVPYYLWSEVFIQSRIFEMKLIREINTEITNSKILWKNVMYRKILRDMQDIYYDDQNHFYGVTNISNIVNSLSETANFNKIWNELYDDIQFEDELHKRGTERSNFMLSFVIAISVGYLNYFAMVFSATSDSQIVGMGWPGIDGNYPWVFTAIAAGACVELVNMFVLAYAEFRALYTKHQYKLIDDHKFEK
ncbi:hypothetical protein [Ureaplasma ceti]|uniref:Uncharacterized protein n=1 Tax=Ureaplasma ceti TaxID=3119530 RepID=A0ABP9UA80_9BACT